MLTIARLPALADRPALPGWAPAAALIAVTVTLGPYLGSATRYLFILASIAAGVYAWRQSPAAHLQAALVLFAFTPFARRVVDFPVGFDHAGVMIAGPLLALLAPLSSGPKLLFHERILDRQLTAHYLIGACVVYASLLSILNGDWTQAISGGLKWAGAAVYGMLLYVRRPDPNKMIDGAVGILLWILPIVGLYGLYQYVNPPTWDRYWMAMAPFVSAGPPEPYAVRTFSTMNAPAAFGTFTGIGLLLVAFRGRGIVAGLVTIPTAIAFLLSLYRTAWLSLIVSLAFCLLFRSTRARSTVVVASAMGIVICALALVPFADVISARLATLFDPSNDVSGQERVAQFFALYSRPDSSVWGNGFSLVDVGVAGAEAVDGMIIACWTSMGIVAGLICLSAVLALIATAIARACADGSQASVLSAAVLLGFLIQVPLATIVSGELGFLFFTFATLALCPTPGRSG